MPSSLVLQVGGISNACFFSWSEAAEREDRSRELLLVAIRALYTLCFSHAGGVCPVGSAVVLHSEKATARDSGDSTHTPSR